MSGLDDLGVDLAGDHSVREHRVAREPDVRSLWRHGDGPGGAADFIERTRDGLSLRVWPTDWGRKNHRSDCPRWFRIGSADAGLLARDLVAIGDHRSRCVERVLADGDAGAGVPLELRDRESGTALSGCVSLGCESHKSPNAGTLGRRVPRVSQI